MSTTRLAQSSRPLGRSCVILHLLTGVLIVFQHAPRGFAASFPIIESFKVHGTGTRDFASGIAYDNHGAVLVSGSTAGSLGGPYLGATDAFVGKFDALGQELFIRQFGTSSFEASNDVASDIDGSIHVAGTAGGFDAFLRKYNSMGDLQWTTQFGTSSGEAANGVTVDPNGNVWVTGQTDGALDGTSFGGRDSFVRKYGPSGNLLWGRQVGTSIWDVSQAITADPFGNTYITGFMFPGLFSSVELQDFFVTKLDADGNVLWSRQQGGALLDQATELTTDSLGNVYVTGVTNSQLGSVQYGSGDMFVTKYDPNGVLLWTKQFGTNLNEIGFGIQIDASGNIFVGGSTLNNPNGGPVTASQGVVLKLDANGDQRWKLILDYFPSDGIYDIALGEPGVLYAVGRIALAVNSPHGFYIAKIRDVPEPSAILLTCLSCAICVSRFGQKTGQNHACSAQGLRKKTGQNYFLDRPRPSGDIHEPPLAGRLVGRFGDAEDVEAVLARVDFGWRTV